jgi:hypothetical protein
MSKQELDIDKYNREAVSIDLVGHSVFAKDGDYIEVTKWGNGDGFDVDLIEAGESEHIRITFSTFNILKKLVKKLDK